MNQTTAATGLAEMTQVTKQGPTRPRVPSAVIPGAPSSRDFSLATPPVAPHQSARRPLPRVPRPAAPSVVAPHQPSVVAPPPPSRLAHRPRCLRLAVSSPSRRRRGPRRLRLAVSSPSRRRRGPRRRDHPRRLAVEIARAASPSRSPAPPRCPSRPSPSQHCVPALPPSAASQTRRRQRRPPLSKPPPWPLVRHRAGTERRGPAAGSGLPAPPPRATSTPQTKGRRAALPESGRTTSLATVAAHQRQPDCASPLPSVKIICTHKGPGSPSLLPYFASLLQVTEFFQNKLVETIQFMEVLNLKNSVEKDIFFRELPNIAEQLPLEIVLKKVRKLQPRREGDGAAMSDKATREWQIVLGPMLGGELGLLGSRRNHATQ
ncbi:serine/arginine repetitive matrix protein 1-like [Panicum virgatum]|uniref:serine/arginine repetitive matrix protein 1-like n=1 Tax=Panicum virgatum TaxID=38727 RepID=UPI0019D5AAFC|nr:serine/arginine repetitive matrix protein 1-like [Panicum virgatum]